MHIIPILGRYKWANVLFDDQPNQRPQIKERLCLKKPKYKAPKGQHPRLPSGFHIHTYVPVCVQVHIYMITCAHMHAPNDFNSRALKMLLFL